MQIRPRLLINIHKSKGHRTLTSLQSKLTTSMFCALSQNYQHYLENDMIILVKLSEKLKNGT